MIPKDFSATEANTYLEMFARSRDAQPGTYPSFRELFSGETTLTTVMNRIDGLLHVLLPKDTPGLGGSVGERLKLLFEERAGDGLRPTKTGMMIADRLMRFGLFFADLSADTKRLTLGLDPNLARIGAPQTLALHLLAYAFSQPDVVSCPGPTTLKVTLDQTRHLLPQLKLGSIDALISYGYLPPGAKERFVYREPDTDGINFAGLNHRLGMILICHPNSPVVSSNGRELAKSKAKTVDPMQIDLRKTTLISVPSWQQGQQTQDLITRAKDVGRHREVTTYDEVLALVRLGGGFGLVPEYFADRKVVLGLKLPPREYDRELGVYYRDTPTLENGTCVPVEACKYIEFLAVYLEHYRPPILPVYNPAGTDPADVTAHAIYLEVISEYRRRFGAFSREDWAEAAKRKYPAAAPTHPAFASVANDEAISPAPPQSTSKKTRKMLKTS